MTTERPEPEDEVTRYDCDGRESPSGYVVAYEDYAKVKHQRDELLEALQAITCEANGQICFRTHNSVPMGMGPRKERIVRAALKGAA